MIEDLREKALPVLLKGTQLSMVRLQSVVFLDMVIRCILPKPWSAKRPIKLTVGKYTEDKRQQLGVPLGQPCGMCIPWRREPGKGPRHR